MRLVAGITATIAALLLPGIDVAAAERSVLVLAPSADDDRLDPAREALAFWNARLAELGVATRLGGPRVVVASPVARVLENYARGVAQRAVRLPGGEAEPDAPPELTRLAADVVLLLSRQDILSYTWPLPRVDPPRHLVVIRRVRGPDRNDAMVTRHVVAHELGHALGLLHNELADTLMCGPCQPLAAESDETGFLPLTDAERARLVALHGDPNE
ncbi:MAG: matrixin family metalloprotease [Acidobacteria bacterium]|nr:matrixin family metalloprotease [Acidobacteriota bacterium]